ncbi:MAG TPA: hypothetical protein VK249_10295 [Anaerolineales bacterium]|nr:hypothetical protein [Anaerolineales bacterium]
MKKIFSLLIPLILAACLNPPVVITDTPAAPTIPPDDVPYLPNPAWQPGVFNPDVTQNTIQTTICVGGYSEKIRPPVSYTNALKVKQIAQYGYADTNTADYEEDHLIALGIGGHPTDPENLWPQPRLTTPWGAPQKDTLENVLHQLICSGQLPLDTGRQAMASDWVAAYRKYVPQSAVPFTAVPPEP